jgi:hypothetical protein
VSRSLAWMVFFPELHYEFIVHYFLKKIRKPLAFRSFIA